MTEEERRSFRRKGKAESQQTHSLKQLIEENKANKEKLQLARLSLAQIAVQLDELRIGIAP
jgi:hypothetical protein